MENLKKLENMVSESDKANLEQSLGAVIEAVLANTDGKKVDVEGKSKKLVEAIENILDREIDGEIDKLVAKDITSVTLDNMINNKMISAIKNSKNRIFKATLNDPCNIAYFKLAQKDKKLKARNINIGALSASVTDLKPRYLEIANAEFERLLEDTLEEVKTNLDCLRCKDVENYVENIATSINAILTQCYKEKYHNIVEKKYIEIEESETSEADRFISELDKSLNGVADAYSLIYSSQFLDSNLFGVSNVVDCYDKLKSKVDNKIDKLLPNLDLTLPKFVTLVMGTNLSPAELKAAQSWLSDKNIETYDAMADLALKRK